MHQEGIPVAEFLNAMVHPLDKPNKLLTADTPMHKACRAGRVAVVRSLMVWGAGWDLPGGINRKTAWEEANDLKRRNRTVHRKLMELMSEPMPPCPNGYRCGSVCASRGGYYFCFNTLCDWCKRALSVSTCVLASLPFADVSTL